MGATMKAQERIRQSRAARGLTQVAVAMKVQERVRQLRTAQGLTQAALAMKMGVHPETVTKVEAWGLVTWRTAKRLGDVLGVDPRELVTRE